MEPAVAKVCLKKPRTVDSNDCFLCQTSTSENFVLKPTSQSYDILSQALNKLLLCESAGALKVPHVVGTHCSEQLLRELDARWHLSCYKRFTLRKTLENEEKRFAAKKQLPPSADEYEQQFASSSKEYFTRSSAPVYTKSRCFFCDGEGKDDNPLHHVSCDSSGSCLQRAVELSGNDSWRVRLAESISPGDAHAIDVLYHKACWTINVRNVLRRVEAQDIVNSNAATIASDIEFIRLVEDFLSEGNVSCMSDLYTTYLNICCSNGLDPDSNIVRSRKNLKQFLYNEIPDIVFTPAKQRNSSARVSLSVTRDAAMWKLEEESDEHQLKMLMQAALVIHKICQSSKKWKFNGTLCCEEEHIPDKLSLFFKWCLVGKSNVTKNTVRINEVDCRSKRLSEILMFECLSRRQATFICGETLYRTRELPLQVGVGLTVHSENRSAKLVDLLSHIGVSVNYDRVKVIENSIAKAVLKRMADSGGVYVPPELKSDRFTHFATDNLDFTEDTPDGKRTLHATVLVAYQSATDDKETITDLMLDESDEPMRIPDTVYELIPCSVQSNAKPLLRNLPRNSQEFITKESLTHARVADISWLLGREQSMTCSNLLQGGLTWSAHNSLVVPNTSRKTTVAVFPILNTSPTERSVQLTVTTQFQKVVEILNGSGKKPVITVDLGLYRPMQQLQMTMSHTNAILMPGDLHILMAMLRAIGTFIELSGIPELWLESGIFGDRVVQGILEGKRVRRSVEAHIVTLQVLFSALCENFFAQQPALQIQLSSLSSKLSASWIDKDKTSVQSANLDLENKLRELAIVEKLTSFCHDLSSRRPTFAATFQYMNMVFSMLAFMRAVRSANWDLRLSALEEFCKYFFAMDLRNYSAMIALHLAEMEALSVEDPETWANLRSGLWSPNKKGFNFCCLGADEALEQVNRKLKVTGGLVGISLKPETLTKYFLVAPYCAKIAANVHESLNDRGSERTEHHQMQQAVDARQLRWMKLLKETFQNFTSPFQYDGDDLINLVTRRVAPDVVRDDVSRMTTVGIEQYKSFVENRLVNRTVNVWDRMPNNNLKLFKTVAKKSVVKTKMGMLEVKNDHSLLTRCLMICRSRPNMVLKEIIGKYELSVVPRSMFHPDGTMMHDSAKSKLMHHLEELGKSDIKSEQIASSAAEVGVTARKFSVAVIDAMAEVQMLNTSNSLTIAELSQCFAEKIMNKYYNFTEVHLVFDTYVDESLKGTERVRREKKTVPVRYKIEQNTRIQNIPMKKLLSHTHTKDDLTECFSKAVIHVASQRSRNVTVSFRNEALSTELDMTDLISTHEEADTKLMLHAVHAARRGAECIRVFSSDTDVLVLAIRRALVLPGYTNFVTLGRNARQINVTNIYQKFGPNRASALPGLHAISGADVTGSFNGKAKTSFWKAFMAAPVNVLRALTALGKTEHIDDDTFSGLEQFICSVYAQTRHVASPHNLADLRWSFYSKKQSQADKTPPTLAALRPAIRRCHYQCIEWDRDIEPHPKLPPACDYGWTFENGRYEPIMCEIQCAPEEVLHLIRCSCTKGRCVPPCKCASQNPRLPCSEMCECGGDPEYCDNTEPVEDIANDDDSSDEDSDTDYF